MTSAGWTTTQGRRGACAVAAVGLVLALGSPAKAEDPPQPAAPLSVRWVPGMRTQTTVWSMESDTELLGEGSAAATSVQGSNLMHLSEELECLEARDGRLEAARACYGSAWAMSEAASSAMQGSVVEYRADAQGRLRPQAGLPGSRLPDNVSLFEGRAKRLDPFRSRMADLARAAEASQGGPTTLEDVAAVLGMGGYASAKSRLEFDAWSGVEPGWCVLAGVLADVSKHARAATDPAGWVSGGAMRFAGSFRVGREAAAATLEGWIYGVVYGTVARDGVLEAIVAQRYLEIEVRLLPPASTKAPEADGPASGDGWPAWLAARGIGLVPVVSRVPDVPDEWRGFALRGARGEALIPAWLGASGRTLDVLGRDGTPERPRRSWAPAPAATGFLALDEPPSGAAPTPEPAPVARRPALAPGPPCWGLQPDGKGGLSVRAWRPSAMVRADEGSSAASLALGLTATDTASGTWLVLDASGNVLGWTLPQGVIALDALLHPAAPPSSPGSTVPGTHATWTYAPRTLRSDMPGLAATLTEATAGDGVPDETAWPFDVLQHARERLLQGRVADAQVAMRELRRRHPIYARLLEGARPMLERQVERALSVGASAELLIGPQLDAAVLQLPEVGGAVRFAGLLGNGKHYDHAFAIAHACMGRAGSDEQALGVAARALNEAERWLDLALLLRQQPLNEGPTWVVATLVDALWHTGQLDEAREVLEAFPEARRDGAVYERIVEARRTAGEVDLALDAARAWSARFPEDPRAYMRVAQGLVLREQYEPALREAERGLALAPDDPQLLAMAACSVFGLERPEQFEALFARLRAVDPARAAEVGKALGIDPPADGK